MPKPPAGASKTKNLIRNSKGVWHAEFYRNGKRWRPSLQTTSRAEALKRLDKLKAAVKTETDKLLELKAGRISWSDAVIRYLEEVAPGKVRESTLERYRCSLRAVNQRLEPLWLDQVDTKVLVDYVSRRKQAGVSNATVNRDLTAISQIMACGMLWGYCTSNPAEDFARHILTKEQREVRQLPSDEVIERVARICHGLLGDLVRFARLEGARQEEVASLTWTSIDLEKGVVRLHKTKTKPRSIRINPRTKALLESLPKPPTGRFVFWHGATGARYQNVSSRFLLARTRLLQAAKDTGEEMQEFTFHDLRHAYAVAELLKGRDVYDLSRHLGHTSVKITELYLGYVPGGAPVSRETDDA